MANQNVLPQGRLQQRISLLIMTIIISLFVEQSYQLECYVCQNQEDNKGKCVETVKICELEQEQCLTEVRWGSKPYWSLVGQKQHFVSKRCATKRECQDHTADKDHKCDRIWYNDWNCTACCSGDKCNHYVTLGANSNHQITLITTLLSCFISLFMLKQYNFPQIKLI